VLQEIEVMVLVIAYLEQQLHMLDEVDDEYLLLDEPQVQDEQDEVVMVQ
jgi:hypothetical protein